MFWLTIVLVAEVAAALGGIASSGSRTFASVLILPIIPLFLVWQVRVRRSADYAEIRQRRTRGWVIGSWFTPVVNLWFPYQIVTDIWKGTVPDDRQAGGWSQLVRLWWACWILAWAFSFHFVHYTQTAADGTTRKFDGVVAYLGSTPVGSALTALAAAFLIPVVRTIGDGQPG